MRNKAYLLFIAVIAIPFYSFSSTTQGFGHYQMLLNHGVIDMNIKLSNLSYNLNKLPLFMSCLCY